MNWPFPDPILTPFRVVFNRQSYTDSLSILLTSAHHWKLLTGRTNLSTFWRRTIGGSGKDIECCNKSRWLSVGKGVIIYQPTGELLLALSDNPVRSVTDVLSKPGNCGANVLVKRSTYIVNSCCLDARRKENPLPGGSESFWRHQVWHLTQLHYSDTAPTSSVFLL